MPYFKYKNKSVYYEEIGQGEPVILIHGNTMSSKMFDCILDLYKSKFKVILIDFLGHGKSDRLDKFETDFWYDEAKQIICLIEENKYKNVSLIGTSGGAIAAINVGLERPDLIDKIVADSFSGECSDENAVFRIEQNREYAKQNEMAVNLWRYNHGDDFENIIDNDTKMIIDHNKNIKNYFHKDVQELRIPALFVASKEDDMVSKADEIVSNMSKKVAQSSYKIFDKGRHPAIISNAQEFFKTAVKFIKSE